MLPLLTLGVTAVKAHNYNSVSSPTLEFRALQKRGKKKRNTPTHFTDNEEARDDELRSSLCSLCRGHTERNSVGRSPRGHISAKTAVLLSAVWTGTLSYAHVRTTSEVMVMT